jgi:hypothetical protein
MFQCSRSIFNLLLDNFYLFKAELKSYLHHLFVLDLPLLCSQTKDYISLTVGYTETIRISTVCSLSYSKGLNLVRLISTLSICI